MRLAGESDDAAAYLFPGVSGRPGGKVVGHPVYDHGSVQDLGGSETVVIKDGPGVAAVGHQRGHIARMGGMSRAGGIIVVPGVLEGVGTVAVLVDMESEECIRVPVHAVRQVVYLDLHDRSSVRYGIKAHRAVQIRIGGVSDDVRQSRRASVSRDVEKEVVKKAVKHDKNSFLLFLCGGAQNVPAVFGA